MGSLFSSPDPSPPPPPPPTPATVANPQTQAAGQAGQANARQGGAMGGTLLTGNKSGANTAGKNLTGSVGGALPAQQSGAMTSNIAGKKLMGE